MPNTGRQWENRRVKTPTVLQMEAVECGAASLAMILAYYGLFVPLDQLRVDCGVSRDGSKASNMIKAARNYGMRASGFRKEPDELHDLSLPMILFWNFNHFVVLEGIRGKWVYLNDPAGGPRKISIAELDQAFTGVVLTFEPGPEFNKGGRRPNIFRSLAERFVDCRQALLFVVLAGLFLMITGLVFPAYTRIFVDDILVNGMESWMEPLVLAMGLTAAAYFILTWIQRYYLVKLQLKLALSGSARFFLHVFRLPIVFFDQRYAGDIAVRVQLNDKVAQLLSGNLAVTIVNLFMVVFYVVVMSQYSIVLTVIGVFFALVNLAALRFVSYRRKNLNMHLRQEYGKIMGVTMNGLQMIETLKATGTESDFFSRWSGYQAKVVNAQQRLSASTQLLSLIPTTLSSLNQVVMLCMGAFLIMKGHMTIGMLIAFQGLMAGFMTPFNTFVNMGSLLQETHADINRLDDVVNNPPDNRFSGEAIVKGMAVPGEPKLTGRLELNKVTFGYSTLESPLIQNFSLSLEPGARVALVGSTGSGKSTIAKLVTGLYAPWEGEILFDDQPLQSITRRVFTNSVSMVDQDLFLFDGTVQDNLTMWDTSVPEEDMIRAGKDACIHDDIVSRPGGYVATMKEAGANFSGGQRQRLEIARSLVCNPSFLVLDEATSALDPPTEKQIDDNIRRRGCSCLIVAHRLSTIRDCDEIIVLDGGKVVQRGTHEELHDQEGLYAELIKEQ